jgi:hypothetical protein
MADASHQEASMPEINTRFLFTLALEIQVSSLGDTPYGRRRMFHFDGGGFDLRDFVDSPIFRRAQGMRTAPLCVEDSLSR